MSKTDTMQKRVYQIVTEEFDSIVELPGTDQQLIAAAREAAEKAYSPY